MRAGNNQDEWLAFALQLATESGAILREAATVRPDVEVKPDRSFVTALDARIERRMREMLADRFPSHGIIGEEEDPSDRDADLVWVLDPIDGTAAFIAGLPVYGSLIALMREGEPILGIIDHPITGDRWIGVKGSPTTHNLLAPAAPAPAARSARPSCPPAIPTSSTRKRPRPSTPCARRPPGASGAAPA